MQTKDQTYFLFGLTQAQLARSLFPLGEMTQVRSARNWRARWDWRWRKRARATRSASCRTATMRHSWTLICARRAWPDADTRGEIVTTDGRTLGEHAGVHHFTVGQRKGLGIAAGEPLYVIATDAAIAAGDRGRNDELLRGRL